MNMKIMSISTLGALLLFLTINACSKKSNPSVSAVTKKEGSGALTATELDGQKIYSAKCGTCHGLKEPSEYTAKEWVPIMNSMAKKAHLTDGEKISVIAFVNKSARVIK